MTWNLVNEIDGKGYTGFSDMEINVIREIKREYEDSLDWFTRSDEETNRELSEIFWKYSREHEIKARGMLTAFNMLQEHIKLSMQDVLFGEIVECLS